MLLFKGKNFLPEIDLIIKNKLEKIQTDKKLAVVILSSNPSHKKFVEIKSKIAHDYGIEVVTYKFTEKTPKKDVYKVLSNLNNDPTVGGIVVQYPFPDKYTFTDISTRINPLKDVDFFTDKNYGAFALNLYEDFMPPVVRALDFLLNTYKLELRGKRYLVLGQGVLVGRPVANYLINRGATVLSLNEYSVNKDYLIKKADVLILGTGTPNLIKPSKLKKGASVIDFGYNLNGSKLEGDLDLNQDISHLNIVSPSPGGLGPLTIRFLFLNFLEFVENQESNPNNSVF